MLFEEDKVSPTTNLLVEMLKCHKLRTTYDLEKAVGISFNMNESKWDFRLLDKLAGVWQKLWAEILEPLPNANTLRKRRCRKSCYRGVRR